MSKVNWQNVETIVDRALELSKDQRHSFVEEQCDGNKELKNEVTTMLNSIFASKGWLQDGDRIKNNLLEDIADRAETNYAPEDDPLIGNKVGSFILKERIGKGGMGAVYRAERNEEDINHCVAVKIIQRGQATQSNIQRFRREQQILADLQHPGIARLYDIGMTGDGLPYLIMEYVNGMPLDIYCRQNQCSLNEKIELFKQILQAVSYAHENLVIHRDLKPANILVDGNKNIKILDFGISKLLRENDDLGLTQTGDRMFTPRYAAPEQIMQRNVSVTSDLYTLGIILYELLTGQSPFDFNSCTRHEMEQIILDTTPPPPSSQVVQETLKQNLKKDLEAIILKAIRKDSAHRYHTANEFLEDLNNYHEGLPVSAVKDSRNYRLKKFSQRHRQGIAVACGVLLLIVGLAGFFTYKIARERDQAKLQAKKAKREALKSQHISSFLMELFAANDPTEALGDTVTAIMLLQRGEKRASDLKKQPRVQAQMFDVIGQVYRRLGHYDRSLHLLNRARDIRATFYKPEDPVNAQTLDHLGLLFTDMSSYDKAERVLKKSMNLKQHYLGKNDLSVSHTQFLLAYVLRRTGNYKGAEALYRKSLDIRRRQLGNNNLLTIQSTSGLGATLHNEGNYKSAERYFRQALKARQKLLGPVHPDIAMSQNSLGALLMNTGKFSEAESLLKQSLVMRERIYGKAHPKVALTMNNLAMVLRDRDKFQQSGSLFEKTLAMRQKLLGAHHIATALTKYSLAGLMLKTQRSDSALILYKKVLPIFIDKLSPTHSFTARTLMGIGSAYLAKNDMPKAKHFLTKGFQIIKQIHPETSLEYALAEKQMAAFMLKSKRYTEADSLLFQSYKTLQTLEGDSSKRQKKVLAMLDEAENESAR